MSPCFDLEFLGPTMRPVPIAVAVRERGLLVHSCFDVLLRTIVALLLMHKRSEEGTFRREINLQQMADDTLAAVNN